MEKIRLTQGKVAIVDDEDQPWLNQFRWYADKIDDHWYAVRTHQRQSILMHRLITGAPKSRVVRHKNDNSLDNRKSNLHVGTKAESAFRPDIHGDFTKYLKILASRRRNPAFGRIVKARKGLNREVWRDVVDYEGVYQISSQGRVRNLCSGMLLKDRKKGSKTIRYTVVTLNKNGSARQYAAHRLVLRAFVGPCPPKYEGCHLDGKPDNNKLNNLAWVTHRENMRHQGLHGTNLIGLRNHKAKVTKIQSEQIQRLRRSGLSCPKIARRFAISYATVWRIVSGNHWTCL